MVVDAANGMGSIYRPLLEQLGIELMPLYFELDGTFPNHEANPLKLENLADLCQEVKKQKADLGVSFDGDADRAAFVDESGEPVGSDLMTALIGGELLNRAPGTHVLYDLRSSRAVAEYIEEHGGVPVRERVGHSFIKATLREKDGIFGGELAGHYYFRDNYNADCALLAVVEVLNLLWRGDETLSELVAAAAALRQEPEINFEVEDKEGKIAELAERFSDGEIDYLDGITVAVPRLVVQRPAVEHRALPAAGARGRDRQGPRGARRAAGDPRHSGRLALPDATQARTPSRCIRAAVLRPCGIATAMPSPRLASAALRSGYDRVRPAVLAAGRSSAGRQSAPSAAGSRAAS